MKVPTFQEILVKLSLAANKRMAESPLPESVNPGRFSVVVKPETRYFLETQADLMGGSIAGLAGAILDGVAMSSDPRFANANEVQGIAEKVHLLIKQHQVSYPAIVDAFDGKIKLSDFASPLSLISKLDIKTLKCVAEVFAVDYDWLVGNSTRVDLRIRNSWYKNQIGYAKYLLDAKDTFERVVLCIVLKDSVDLTLKDAAERDAKDKSSQDFIPILRREKYVGGETLVTWDRAESGTWFYWRCRHHIKQIIWFAKKANIPVDGVRIDNKTFDLIAEGSLPLRSILGSYQRCSWFPEELVSKNSDRENADVQEWIDIEDSKSNKFEFEYMNKLLAERNERYRKMFGLGDEPQLEKSVPSSADQSDEVILSPGNAKQSEAGVTEIQYRISFQDQLAGTARVSYVKNDQVAFIENIEIKPELRRQGIGRKAVAWLVLHTPYVVGTRCEWESAYEFWREMRKIHGERMLPAPK